jgi:chaperonin GroES
MKKNKSKKDSGSRVVPLGDRILVRPIREDELKSKSGIIIPESVSKEKPERGKVVAVGEGKWNEDGDKRIPPSVRVGDVVLFSKYSPDEIKMDEEEYFILREENILAIIK